MEKKARLADRKFIEEEKKNWGKGTVICKSWAEYEQLAEKFKDGAFSPGGAAGQLGVSRTYINQLEKEGKIRAYRIIVDDKLRKEMPFWLKVFMPTKEVYILIPAEDIEDVKKEMISRAEEKIKRLKKK